LGFLVLSGIRKIHDAKSEIRNPNDESIPNDEIRIGFHSVIRVSDLIRHSDFGFRVFRD